MTEATTAPQRLRRAAGKMPPDAGPGQLPASLTRRRFGAILAGLMLGMFLSALDQTIVVAAARTIGDDLNGLSQQAWLTTAYLVASTISTPIYGRLGDLYGPRRVLLVSVGIFLAGSAACSGATSMTMLAGLRVVQGLGAGGLFSLPLAILARLTNPRERAKYQSYTLSVFGISSVIGPVLGGFLAGADRILGIRGWRWVFLINVPIGLVAFAVLAVFLHLPHRRRPERIDVLGAVLLTISLVPLLTVLQQGRDWGWGSTRSIACYAASAVGLLLFVASQHRAGDQALMPLRFFRNPTFSLLSAAAVSTGMGTFGGLAVLPLYLQIVQGRTPGQAGLLALPLTIGLMTGSIVSGRQIARTGRYKIFPIVGTALMIVGMSLLWTLDVDTPLWWTEIYTTVFGLGLGAVIQTLTLAVQTAVPPPDIGVATASVVFNRQVGATIGTAVFLSILFSTVGANIGTAFVEAARTTSFRQALHDPAVRADPRNAPILATLRGNAPAGAVNDTAFLASADPRLARPLLIGFSTSLDQVFGVGALVLLPALVLLLFIREVPLRAVAAVPVPPGRTAGTAAGPDPRAAGGAPGAGAGPEPQPSLSVSGIVTDAAGSPVDGVALVLIDLTGRQAGLARTGPGGTYRLDTPAGHAAHLLLCTAPGYQPTASIVVATQPDLRRDLTLVRSSSITGTVWRQDTPLGGVAVALADARGQVVAAATTSASGHYGFGHLRPGTYTISTGSGRRSAPQTVSVPAGTDLSNDVHVDTGTELAGTVQFVGAGTGEPLRAWVLLMDSSGQITLSSFTRSDGTFHFPDVQPGAYTLIAGGPAPVAQQIVVRAEPAQHVELTLGSELAADVPQVSGTPFPTSRPAGTGIGRHRTATTMNGGSANGAALDAAARDTLTKIVAAEASAGGELSAEGAAAALLLQHSGQDQATQTSTPAAARHRAAATATEVTGSGAAPSRATTRQRRGRRRRTRLTGVGVGVVLLIAGLAAMLRLVDGGHPLPLTASLHTPTAAPTSVAARMTPGAPDRHGEAVAPPPGTGAGTLILSLGRSTCQQTPSRRPAAQPRKTAHPATAPIRYTGTAAGSPAPQTEHRPSPVGAAASAACIPVRG